MNRIYRVLWNVSTGAWTVASELAHGRRRGAGRAGLPLTPCTAAACFLFISMAHAQSQCGGSGGAPVADACQIPVFDPTTHDGLANPGLTRVVGGDSVTLQGSATQIVPGITGITIVSLADLYAAGLTTDPRANPDNPASLVINTGARSQVIVISDPITGGTSNVAVFDNANILDTHATSVVGGYNVQLNGSTNGRQYIATRVGQVDASGGTLRFEVGDIAQPTDAPGNFVDFGMAKQSSMLYADGTGSATSTVIWQGSNLVNMGSALGTVNAAGPGPAQSTGSFVFYTYRGTFTTLAGGSATVTSDAELRDYNALLIQQLQSGVLNPADYEAAFSLAFTSAAAPITYTNGPPLPDEAYEPIGVRAVIQANGANAQGVIAAGSRLDVRIVSNISPGISSGGMVATNGGTVTNNGQLSFVRGGYDVGAGMAVLTGGHGINTGVMNAGFVAGLTGAENPDAPAYLDSTHGAWVEGAGSTFVNSAGAILNVAGPGSRGAELLSSSTGSNAGTINVGVVTAPGTSGTNRTEGIRVRTGSSFTNQPGGLIYLGRQPQYSDGAAVPDVANGANAISGVVILTTGSATNAGTITIGSLVDGGSAMFASSSSGAVVNSGVININGAAGAAPVENLGLDVRSATNVSNTGTINVNGVNGIGIRLLAGTTTRAASSGVINVNGGLGPTGLRNYGIWSEGANALATLSGTVNLSGEGAIGVHARGGGDVNITGAGNVDFLSGSNQIGYFLYGTGSIITNSGTAAQDVSTEGSTLFRIEDGAVFSGGSGGSAFTASGTGSTAFNITGANATFDSGNMVLNVAGADAVGVLVEGSAIGTINDTAIINQTGLGSVIGIVDGQKHSLAGAPVGAPDATTRLTNQAAVVSGGDGALGFIARNQGTLLNQGTIGMLGAGATGVHVLAGGVLDNQADISIDNGTGIDLEGQNSQVRNTATVLVSDGVAALHVHDGGGGVVGGELVGDGGAHAILVGAGSTGLNATDVSLETRGTGHGIENAAEISAITLQNTDVTVSDGIGIRTATSLDPASTVSLRVVGSGIGFAYQTVDGSSATTPMELGSGYVVDGSGAGAVGIFANTRSKVTTAATVAMNSSAAGAAFVAGTASSSLNTGRLSSTSTAAPVVDLRNGGGTTFTNAGTVAAAGVDAHAIAGSAGPDTVNLRSGAVVGILAAGAGVDNVDWSGGSLSGSIEMGDDDDTLSLSGVDLATTYHLDGGAGEDSLILTGIVHRGGSFTVDDLAKGVNLGEAWETITLGGGTAFTLTDNLRLGGSTLNLAAGSTLYAGNGVMPVIGTPSGAPVTVNNAGTLDLTNGTTGATDVLTVEGAYVGQGGRLRLETVLNEGGAASTSDRLVAQTSAVGSAGTGVEIVASDLTGAVTTGDGILLVDVVGASAPDAFALSNRVVGGAYEYLLFQGGLATGGGDPGDGNWYLRNVTDDVVPPDPPDPPLPPPDPPPPPEPPQPPEPPPPEPPGPIIQILRPEAAVYLANQAAAAGMFVHTLHDRLGEVDFTERLRGDGSAAGAWGRATRTQFDTTAGELGQVDVGTDTSFYQVGGDLARWDQGDRRWLWGLMGGYVQANTEAVSKVTGYSARGRVRGYHAGVYGTWYQSAAESTGLYVDGWLIYGQNRHRVHGDLLPQERYDSHTWTGSVESGYALEIGRGQSNAWHIEIQAQLVYAQYSDGDHVEANGTVEQSRDAGGLTTRLGARIYPRPLSLAYNRVQPFAEVNWWHADSRNTIAFNGDVQSLNHGRDVYELKLGLQAELGSGWTGWGHMALRTADGDYRNVEGMLGLKYGW